MKLPGEQEIDRKLAEIHKTQRKLYAIYRLKSFFGIPTKGLSDELSLVLYSILQKNPGKPYSFVIIKGIERFNPADLNEYHSKALRIDENSYTSIFCNTEQNFGDFVIGKNIADQLSSEKIRLLKVNFQKRIAHKHYLKAVEELVRSINRQLADHR